MVRRRLLRFARRKARGYLRRYGRRRVGRLLRRANRWKAHTFRKLKTRVAGRMRTKTLSALTKAYRRITSVLDIDPEYYNSSDTQITIPQSTTIERSFFGYKPLFAQLHTAGNRIKFKSINERLYFHPSTFSATSLSRAKVRVLYVLCKDEEISSETDLFDLASSNYLSLNPPLMPNPGITWTTLFDRTYFVSANTPREIAINLPSSVFYDGGSVQYTVNSATPVQKNNFLYRILFVSSPQFDLKVDCTRRVKFFDHGASGSQVAALTEKVDQLGSKVAELQSALTTLRYDAVKYNDDFQTMFAYGGRLYHLSDQVIDYANGSGSSERHTTTYKTASANSVVLYGATVENVLAGAFGLVWGWNRLYRDHGLNTQFSSYGTPRVVPTFPYE